MLRSNVQHIQSKNMQKCRYGPLNSWSISLFFSARLCLHVVCAIYYSICTEWTCIINMNVHNLGQMKKEQRFSSLQPVGGAVETSGGTAAGQPRTFKKIKTRQSLRSASHKVRNFGFPSSCRGRSVFGVSIQEWQATLWRTKMNLLLIM